MSSSAEQKQDIARNDSFAINKTVVGGGDSSLIEHTPTIVDQVVNEEEVTKAIATLGLEDESAGPVKSENEKPGAVLDATASDAKGEDSTDKATVETTASKPEDQDNTSKVATQNEAAKRNDSENISPKVALDTAASKSEGDGGIDKAAPQLEATKPEDSVDMAALQKTFESFGKDLQLGTRKPEGEVSQHEAATKDDTTKGKDDGDTSQSNNEVAKPTLENNPRLATYVKLHNDVSPRSCTYPLANSH